MTEPEENEEKTPKTDAVLDPRELRHPSSTANPSRTRVPAEGLRGNIEPGRAEEPEQDELEQREQERDAGERPAPGEEA